MAMEQYEKAIADYDKAVAFDPRDGDAIFNRGLAHELQKQYDQAIADYTEGLRLRPDDAAAWFRLGVANTMLKQYGPADDAFVHLANSDPGQAAIFVFGKNDKGGPDQEALGLDVLKNLNAESAEGFSIAVRFISCSGIMIRRSSNTIKRSS